MSNGICNVGGPEGPCSSTCRSIIAADEVASGAEAEEVDGSGDASCPDVVGLVWIRMAANVFSGGLEGGVGSAPRLRSDVFRSGSSACLLLRYSVQVSLVPWPPSRLDHLGGGSAPMRFNGASGASENRVGTALCFNLDLVQRQLNMLSSK